MDAISKRCCEQKGTIVHTLVDETLRRHVTETTDRYCVPHIDLVGALLGKLTEVLQQQPIGHPGLYRKLHQAYFERVETIEFTMAHDDGKDPKARSGKTTWARPDRRPAPTVSSLPGNPERVSHA